MSHRAEILKQLDRLVESEVLHGSESLCKLLRYLANHALEQPGAPVKEYQIATEVYGRPADFDPQSDSTIRVQAGRLRSKLAEYYVGKGAEDPVVVELPKGSYLVSFHMRSQNGSKPAIAPPEVHAIPAAPINWAVPFAIVSLLLLAAAGWIVALLAQPPAAKTANAAPAPASLKTFWKPFLAGPDEPWVIFSNAAFVGRPETGMRYYNAQSDAKERIWDHYTGVGEVLAVHSLDQAFSQLGKRLRVKRGSLFSLDDAENNNLIFVGSPSENLTLADLPNTREFVFRRVESGARHGDLAIANVDPAPGEPTQFLASPSSALIGLIPGLTASHWILILAGTTTFGTQGAVEYVSRTDSLDALLSRLGVAKGDDLQPFEALLHVKVTRGVPVETELIAVRKTQKR